MTKEGRTGEYLPDYLTLKSKILLHQSLSCPASIFEVMSTRHRISEGQKLKNFSLRTLNNTVPLCSLKQAGGGVRVMKRQLNLQVSDLQTFQTFSSGAQFFLENWLKSSGSVLLCLHALVLITGKHN